MNMLSNEKINFKSLEENTFKEMMKLGEKIKKIEEEKIKLYEEGKIEEEKEIFQLDMAHDIKLLNFLLTFFIPRYTMYNIHRISRYKGGIYEN